VRRLMERQRRALASHDAGFTLIEILVALFLTLVIMAALLGVLVSSLRTVAQARQRQTATALATQTLERLRALPYDSVTGPDAVAYPVSTIPALQWAPLAAGVYTFTPPASLLPGVAEPLVVNHYSGKAVTQLIDGVTYTVQTYVTKPAPTTAGEQAYNLTALVSWTSPTVPAGRTIVQRSTTFSPPGCLSTAQRPFSAPCQAYFTAQAGMAAAGFSVTNSVDSAQDIFGFDGSKALQLNLPMLSTNLQIEQTASGSASSVTSGVRAVAGTTATSGSNSAAVAVDSDPSSTPNQSATATIGQSSTPVTLSGFGGTLSARPTGGDTGNAWAAIQAEDGVCPDGTQAGAGLLTGPSGSLRPCAAANSHQLGAGGAIDYSSLSGDSMSVLSLSPAPYISRAVAAQLATTNGEACIAGTAGPPGCAHSSAYRSLGYLVVGAPPGGVGPPALTSGVFNVTGLTENILAERGIAAGAPTYSRAGTLNIWNGSGYTPVDLGAYKLPGVNPPPWVIPTVMIAYPDGLTIKVEGSVSIQRPTNTTSGLAPCKAVACVAQVSGAGIVHAQTVFTVNQGGTDIASFVVVSDLGGLIAQSTYKAAPDE